MVQIADSLIEWLEIHYPAFVRMVREGCVDVISEEMFASYCAWCRRNGKAPGGKHGKNER